MVNLYGNKKYAKVQKELTKELYRLKKQVGDEDQFANYDLKSGIVPRDKYAKDMKIAIRHDM